MDRIVRCLRTAKTQLALVLALALTASLLTLDAAPARAAGGDYTMFPIRPHTIPWDITTGPDGNLWYTAPGYDEIGRISPTGSWTHFTDPADKISSPYGITAGPDGNLWFTSEYNDRIGRITPSGAITSYDDVLDKIDAPRGITAGPDGNLWFTSRGNNRIGRITTTGTVTTFQDPRSQISQPEGIAAGADGNLWFTSRGNRRIGRITPSGSITTFADPAGLVVSPSGITPGPRGNMWFTTETRIGRITPAGRITTFGTHVLEPKEIVAAADGNLWFGDRRTQSISRITISGDVTTFRLPGDYVGNPRSITTGPDGHLWFTATAIPAAVGRIELPDCNRNPLRHGYSDVPSGAWYESGLNWALCHGLFLAVDTFHPNDAVERISFVRLVWTMVDPVGPWPPHGFTDVPTDAWYGLPVSWAKFTGVVSGFPGNVFRPYESINRAQFVAWLWNLVGQPGGSPPHGFADVPTGAWFGPALDWAKAQGIVTGFPGNVYRPGDPVLRSQAVQMLYALNSTRAAWSAWTGPALPTWRF